MRSLEVQDTMRRIAESQTDPVTHDKSTSRAACEVCRFPISQGQDAYDVADASGAVVHLDAACLAIWTRERNSRWGSR
jgi:hypothetical protein